MRSVAVVAGLAAVASADVLTVTTTQDVTVTYCAPSVTNCPGKNPWEQWVNTPVQDTTTWNSWDPVKPVTTPPAKWQNVPNPPKPGQPDTWVYWYDSDGKKCSTPAWNDWDYKTPKPTAAWIEWNGQSAPYDWDDWKNAPQPPKPTGAYGWSNVKEVDYYIYWVDESGTKCSTPAWADWDVKKPKPTDAWVEWNVKGETKTITYDWQNWNAVPAKGQDTYVYWYDVEGKKCSTPAGASWDDKTPAPTNAWVEWDVQDGKKTVAYDWQNWSNVPVKPTPVADTWKNVPVKPTPVANTWNNVPVKPTPVAGETWSNVPVTPVKPTPVAGEEWKNANCPMYTATGAPEWFAWLPADKSKEMADKWAAGPPKDWCYYSYSASPAMKTSTVPAGAQWSNADVKPTSTGWSPVAKFTGAANANTGSLAFAGLAGLAAIIIA